MEHTIPLKNVNWPACGRVIRDRRVELGLSVQSLADTAGILDSEVVSGLEEGKQQKALGFASMQSLANALKLDLSSMLAGKKILTPERIELTKQLDRIDGTIQSLAGWRNDLLLRIAHLSDSRYEVRQTEESQEPVYCIYDSEKQEYITSQDGTMITFQDSEMAFDYCDRLNENPELEEAILEGYQSPDNERTETVEKNVSESDTKDKEKKKEEDEPEESEERTEYYEPTPSAGLRV